MNRSTHFSGQATLLSDNKKLNKSKILHSAINIATNAILEQGDSWTHLVVMLHAVIMHFCSLCKMASQTETRKLCHLVTSPNNFSAVNRCCPEGHI